MKKIIPNFYIILKIMGLCFLMSSIFVNANDENPLNYSRKLILHNKIDSAIVFINQQLSKSNSEIDQAFLLIELGNAYKLKQQYEKSLEVYQKSLKIFQIKNRSQDVFYVYTQLAEFYRYRRLYKKSNEYLKVCEQILKNEKVKDAYLMKFYSRKAALFAEYEDDKDSAIVYSKKSLALSQKLGDSENELVSLMEIAGNYENKKDYTEAIKQYNKVLALATKTHNIQVQCDAINI
jgi:tetratricopeptide (TPR) repeat protein